MVLLQYRQKTIEMNDNNESEVRNLLVSTLPPDEVITILDEDLEIIEILRLNELFNYKH
jgi:hypothetical protein